MVVTQDFWTRVDMKKKSVTMVGVWKQECGDQKLSRKKNQIHENIAYEVIDRRVQIWDEIKNMW
jgi:hypothetical protein